MIRAFKQYTPSIATTAFVDPTALVIGNVFVGEEVSIWPMAVVRGDVNKIDIGDRTNIQDGSVLHVAHEDIEYGVHGFGLKIGRDVTVGHRVVLHGCTIHDEVLCGIGSIIMDGAVVGSHVIVGAGSLVPPGKVLESGYLWLGTPVKKIRPLTAEEIAYFKYSAQHYVSLAAGYER